MKVVTERPRLQKEKVSVVTVLRMANNNSDKSANDTQEVHFERALLYDEESLPEAGKTPTKPIQGADLAVTVDRDKGDLGSNSMPSQGLYMYPPSSMRVTCPDIL